MARRFALAFVVAVMLALTASAADAFYISCSYFTWPFCW